MTKRSRRRMLLASALASLACSAALASVAQAVPAWYFNGKELVGSETVLADGVKSSMSFVGFATKCDLDLVMKISNVSGTGQGTVIEAPSSNCTTNEPACSVEGFEPEKFPWAVNLTTIGFAHYVVIKGMKISVTYTGPECAVSELLIPIIGSAGGSYTNSIEVLTFSPANSKTTGTELSVFGTRVDWDGIFTMEALEFHNGEELTIK